MERKYGHSRNQSTHHTSVHITKRCTLYRRPTDNCYNGRVMTAAPMIGNHSPAWCSLGKWRGLRGSIMRYRASERRKLALNRLCTFVTALMVVGCDLLPRSPSIQIEALKGRILFVSHHSGNFDIYRINADGSDLRQLTTSPATDDTPAWSPDGQQIAFSSGKDIQIMNADGSGQFSLVHTAEDHSYPSWSPDGQRIAFTTGDIGNYNIDIINVDGSGLTHLTAASPFAGNARNPVWSPDGQQLAFMSIRDGNWEIYIQGFAPCTTVDIRNEISVCAYGTGVLCGIGRILLHMSQALPGARPCHFYQAGYAIAVLNPSQVVQYTRSLPRRAKTDALAGFRATYCKEPSRIRRCAAPTISSSRRPSGSRGASSATRAHSATRSRFSWRSLNGRRLTRTQSASHTTCPGSLKNGSKQVRKNNLT